MHTPIALALAIGSGAVWLAPLPARLQTTQPPTLTPAPSPTAPPIPVAPPLPPPGAITLLKVGDPAPSLAFDRLLAGSFPTLEITPQRGTVYVIEFWATWCPVCRRTLVALGDLQTKLTGSNVVCLAVNGVDSRGESLERAERFIAGLTAKPAIPMFFDKGATSRAAYLRPARIAALPAAFVVDKSGMIAWIGNPAADREDFESVVTQCAEDRFDLPAAVKRFQERLAKRALDDEQAAALQVKLRDATRDGDHVGALAAIDGLIAIDKDRYGRLAVSRFEILLRAKGDPDAAIAYARTVIEKDTGTDAEVLEQLAWALLDVADVRALSAARTDLALTAATKACDATLNDDPAALDTLARAWFAKGDLVKAESFASKATAKSIGTPLHEPIRARLEEYRGKKGK